MHGEMLQTRHGNSILKCDLNSLIFELALYKIGLHVSSPSFTVLQKGSIMKLLLITVLLTLLSAFVHANPWPADSTEISNYVLVAQADTFPPDLYEKFYNQLMTTGNTDFLGMRLAYLKSNLLHPFGMDSRLKDSLYRAIDMKDFNKGEKLINSLLQNYFPVIPVQIWAEVFYSAKGDTVSAHKHARYYDELFRALLKSGDGFAAKTGYIPVDILEEYELLKVWQLSFTHQYLEHIDGHSFDRITANNPETGKEESIFFNITLIMNAEEKGLQTKRAH